MKSLLKISAFIPLGIHLLFLIFLNKIANIIWYSHILIAILLLVIGVGVISKKKIIQRSGNISLILLTTWLCVTGYYDYIQWFSTIVGVVIFIYFMIIEIVIKKLKLV